MPTVQEVLRATGLSDSDIEKLDQRATTAFSNVLTQAQDARAAAELAQRSNVEFYETSIVPALTSWESERNEILNARAKAEAEAAFYRTQNETARTGGFIPSDAPGYQPRDGQSGRYVAATQGGSPTFTMEDVRNGLGSTLGTLTDIQWKYQTLYNKPMPISPTELVREAESKKLDPATLASQKFNFAQREQELQQQREKEHDDQIRAEATAERDRFWAERQGSNPDVRTAVPSANAEITRAVKSGQRPDPLLMNDEARHNVTRQQIRQRISEESS